MESVAQAAKENFKNQRLSELRQLAKDSIVGRRAQAVKALMLARNEARNIFKWSREVQHSKQNFLVYNKRHGLLSNARNVIVHLGSDNWWQMEKEVYEGCTSIVTTYLHLLFQNCFEPYAPVHQLQGIESWS